MNDSSETQKRVLIVEDEYLIRMLLEDMLADLGYGVAAAASPARRPAAILRRSTTCASR